MAQITCLKCGKTAKIPDAAVGQRFSCLCGTTINGEGYLKMKCPELKFKRGKPIIPKGRRKG